MAARDEKKPQRSSAVKARDQRIKFDVNDFTILDLTLDQIPELRICAGIVKAARAAKLQYPVTSRAQLDRLLPDKEVVVEGHRLRQAHIARYMPKEFFPIADERELISRCYIGLLRCREDMAWAARAPAYATSLLEELEHVTRQEGEG
jgi:hypothetical protein